MIIMTAGSMLDLVLDEVYDAPEAARHRPFAAFWKGWTHPRADHAAPSETGERFAAPVKAAAR